MSSSILDNAPRLPEHMGDDEQRVKILEYLLEKLKRESLALVRQSEAACELLGGCIEDLEEQVQELSQQEDFLTERVSYWRQRLSDLEESKQNERRRLEARIHRDTVIEMEYLIDRSVLHSRLRDKDQEIARLGRLTAGDDSPLSEAIKKTKEPRPNNDPIPSWLENNPPEDWYGIALRASRPSEDGESESLYSAPIPSDNDVSGQNSPRPTYSNPRQYDFRAQFGSTPSVRSEPSNLQDEDRGLDEEIEADVESDISQSRNEEQEDPEGVEKLKAEVEMLRLRVQILEDKEKAYREQERRRGKLHAEFLRWAPKVQQAGWLTNKVRKAYAACQKIVEALELAD